MNIFPAPGMRRIWTCPKHGEGVTTMFMTFEKIPDRNAAYCLMCLQDRLTAVGIYSLMAYHDVPDPAPAQSN